jgi:hypothetical protein
MRIRFTRDFYCQGKCGRVNFRDHFHQGEIVPEGNSEGCEVTRMDDGSFRITHPSVRGYEIAGIPADAVVVLA